MLGLFGAIISPLFVFLLSSRRVSCAVACQHFAVCFMCIYSLIGSVFLRCGLFRTVFLSVPPVTPLASLTLRCCALLLAVVRPMTLCHRCLSSVRLSAHNSLVVRSCSIFLVVLHAPSVTSNGQLLISLYVLSCVVCCCADADAAGADQPRAAPQRAHRPLPQYVCLCVCVFLFLVVFVLALFGIVVVVRLCALFRCSFVMNKESPTVNTLVCFVLIVIYLCFLGCFVLHFVSTVQFLRLHPQVVLSHHFLVLIVQASFCP